MVRMRKWAGAGLEAETSLTAKLALRHDRRGGGQKRGEPGSVPFTPFCVDPVPRPPYLQGMSEVVLQFLSQEQLEELLKATKRAMQ